MLGCTTLRGHGYGQVRGGGCRGTPWSREEPPSLRLVTRWAIHHLRVSFILPLIVHFTLIVYCTVYIVHCTLYKLHKWRNFCAVQTSTFTSLLFFLSQPFFPLFIPVSCLNRSADRKVHIWDAKDTTRLQEMYYLPGHMASVNQAVFHPYAEERVLASCGSDKQIFVGEYP